MLIPKIIPIEISIWLITFLFILDILIFCLLPLEFHHMDRHSIIILLKKLRKNWILGLGLPLCPRKVNFFSQIMVTMKIFRCILERTCLDKHKLSLSERSKTLLSKIDSVILKNSWRLVGCSMWKLVKNRIFLLKLHKRSWFFRLSLQRVDISDSNNLGLKLLMFIMILIY